MSTVVTIESATLIHGDCEAHAAKLLAADIVFGDPPYGNNYRVNARPPRGCNLNRVTVTATAAQEPIHGDDRWFDPAIWLNARRLALFGADNFSHRLPRGGKWIVWDKRCGSAQDDHSDFEIVWTNLAGANRIHRQKWRGMIREGEENCSNSRKLHPNQKPVALCTYVLEQIGAEPGMTVADPWMGSGSLLIAAARMGLNVVGCEIDERHFSTAVERFRAERFDAWEHISKPVSRVLSNAAQRIGEREREGGGSA